MSEHRCKNCTTGEGDTCTLTGATHTTGIECPSFGQKESEMFKVGDDVKVVSGTMRESVGVITLVQGGTYRVDVGGGNFGIPSSDLELVEVKIEEGGFRVRETDDHCNTWTVADGDKCADSEDYIQCDGTLGNCEVYETKDQAQEALDLYLKSQETPTEAGHAARTFGDHPMEACMDKIRTFSSGATRDTNQGKLDYMKALSPIVLRRYVQYLDKHRLQSDGSYRDFDNWKKGIPEKAYISGGGRHFMDTWLLTENYATEDNHGPVEIEDAICAQLFNLMGRLHEMLKVKTITTLPGGDAQCEQP